MTTFIIPAADQPARNPDTRRSGFALPLANVVLALLTMGLVAGFSMTSSELSTAASQRAEARAYSNAQRGLEAFLTRRKDKAGNVMFCPHCWAVNASPQAGTVVPNLDGLPTVRESVTVAFAGGKALVIATPVWVNVAAGKGKYFLTSTGVDSTSGLGGGSGRQSMASRTVGVFVTWNTQTLNVLGAWTSLTGIVKNGTGTISGVDQCGSGKNVAGISVPQFAGHADLVVAGNWQPTGSPAYDTTKTFSQESSSVRIDWAGLKSGTLVPADIVIGAGTFPSVATFAADTNYWPVIHVTNGGGSAFGLPNRGRGMLIVDGDLTISGSNQWYGVILVGGILTSNGNNVSEGATISGLNALTGTRPTNSLSADDATANGQKSYVYDSCSVAKATSSFARYTMMPNTWMDNLPGY